MEKKLMHIYMLVIGLIIGLIAGWLLFGNYFSNTGNAKLIINNEPAGDEAEYNCRSNCIALSQTYYDTCILNGGGPATCVLEKNAFFIGCLAGCYNTVPIK